LGVWREAIRKELQGNETVELGVLGLVDHTHATTAQLLNNSVVGDGLTNHVGEAFS
jgi:hypothetical protein